jgi:hypothetical protein
MTIKSEFDPGANIEDSFKEAINVATILHCIIEFDFNGVTCLAYPNSHPEFGRDQYHRVIQSKERFKIAFSK